MSQCFYVPLEVWCLRIGIAKVSLMKKIILRAYTLIGALIFYFVGFAECSAAEDVSIEVELDCDKRTSAIDILIKIKNEELNDPIYLDAVQLGLDGNLPNVYEIIPIKNLGIYAYKHAVQYMKPIPNESYGRDGSKSYFKLFPKETITIRDPISRFYKMDIKVKYRITTFFSFKSHDEALTQHQIRFHYSKKCFNYDGIYWLGDAKIEILRE